MGKHVSVNDLYEMIDIYEDLFKFDTAILNDTNLNIDKLCEVFTEEQIRFIRYLISLDIEMVKQSIRHMRKRLIEIETNDIHKMFLVKR